VTLIHAVLECFSVGRPPTKAVRYADDALTSCRPNFNRHSRILNALDCSVWVADIDFRVETVPYV
jgi:hypothetical protein